MADISKIKINDVTYDIKDATARTNAASAVTTANAAQTTADGKVSKSGDTMTASLIINVDNIDASVTPSSATWGPTCFQISGQNGIDGYVRLNAQTNGAQGVQIETRRNVNETLKYNGMRFEIKTDGTLAFSSQSFKNGTSDLTSGVSALGDGCYYFQYE